MEKVDVARVVKPQVYKAVEVGGSAVYKRHRLNVRIQRRVYDPETQLPWSAPWTTVSAVLISCT